MICTADWLSVGFGDSAWFVGDCWVWLLTTKVFTSLFIPLIIIFSGAALQFLVTHEWRREHFVFGTSMVMATIGLTAGGVFEWIRGAISPFVNNMPTYKELVMCLICYVFSIAALFFIMALEIPYRKKVISGSSCSADPIEIWRLFAINSLGAASLFASLIWLL